MFEIENSRSIKHIELAKACLQQGNRQTAKTHFLEALYQNPNHIGILCHLAIFYRQEGHFSEAIRYFKKALRIDPNIKDTHQQLANTYAMQNQFDLALTHYQEALKLGEQSPNIHRNMGMIYFGDNQWEPASSHLNRAFDKTKDSLIGLPLGQALLNMGRTQDAERVYQTILQQEPECHDAHHNLAILRLNAEDKLAAKRHFQAASALQPNNATAQHMLHALNANTQIAAAPPEYTKALFDQYAPYYDRHMRDLDYNLPLLMRNLLGEQISTHAQNISVLDLGCGTGICGLYCRDLAHHLIGVDLSDKMLAMAKQRGAYDKLIEASLQTYLEDNDYGPVDVIIAAEVLNYLGDLKSLWPGIIKNLNPGGCFVFSTENPNTVAQNALGPQDNCRLAQTGRFTHDPDGLRAQIETQPALRIQSLREIPLRKHKDSIITGQLWCLISAT